MTKSSRLRDRWGGGEQPLVTQHGPQHIDSAPGEREQAHAEGEHAMCGNECHYADARIPTCYVQFMGGAHCATPPVVEQPAEAQPADRARAYSNLYAELTRGVSHAQVRHHLITEYRAAILCEVAAMFEAEVDDCPAVAGCPPCDVRSAFAARLRRMADEETR